MNYYRFKAFLFMFFSCFVIQTALFAQSNAKITIKKKEYYVAGGFTTNRKTVNLPGSL